MFLLNSRPRTPGKSAFGTVCGRRNGRGLSAVAGSQHRALASISTAFELEGNVLDNGAPCRPRRTGVRPPRATPPTASSPSTAPAPGSSAHRCRPGSSTLGSSGTSRSGRRRTTPRSRTGPRTPATSAAAATTGRASRPTTSPTRATSRTRTRPSTTTPSFTPSHLVLYFGMEKNTPNGDNNMGVWFLQDGTVNCNAGSGAGTSFTGVHKDGDVLLVAAFTNGGGSPSISAYKWVGSLPDCSTRIRSPPVRPAPRQPPSARSPTAPP